MVELHLSPAAALALGDVPMVWSINDYKPICPVATKLLPDGTPARSRRARSAGVEVAWDGPLARDRPRYALIGRAIARAGVVVTCSEWMRRALAADGIRTGSSTSRRRRPRRGSCGRRDGPLLVFVGG